MQNNGIRAIISANQHLWLKITPPVRVSRVGRRVMGWGVVFYLGVTQVPFGEELGALLLQTLWRDS